MKRLNRSDMLSHMKAGVVYRREALLSFSKTLDRDLATLVAERKLEKPATGLYTKPEHSRFGMLPPSDEALVKAFLKKPFLMYSWNSYNTLGLGLTQLYNQVVVYNSERHEKITLGSRVFDFKRPNNGFPLELTREFLLIDLLNNAKDLTEDTEQLKSRVIRNIQKFNSKLLQKFAVEYGKVATRKFIALVVGE